MFPCFPGDGERSFGEANTELPVVGGVERRREEFPPLRLGRGDQLLKWKRVQGGPIEPFTIRNDRVGGSEIDTDVELGLHGG